MAVAPINPTACRAANFIDREVSLSSLKTTLGGGKRQAAAWAVAAAVLLSWLAMPIFDAAAPRVSTGLETRAEAAVNLQRHSSRAYTIHSDLPREQVRLYAEHMDKVFREYHERFAGFRGEPSQAMPLYLFSTQQVYLEFMRHHGIDATNSGGMFFVRPQVQGLAVFVEGNSRSQTFSVLQHEGFHQFAYHFIGPDLPMWANEGLAQYFEDGIILGKSMKLGIANRNRIDRVRAALEAGKAIPLDQLLMIDSQTWGQTLNSDPQRAALLYAQSWSVVYFLVHGDGGRYRRAFEEYLRLVSEGRPSDTAFRKAFGSQDIEPFRRRWEAFAGRHQPDALTTAVARMEFLAAGLRFLHEKREPAPRSIEELRQRLQAVEFRIVRESHGLQEQLSAADAANFTYPRSSGNDRPFQLLEPARGDLPPRLYAPGLRPEPTLVWDRDGQQSLVSDIEYR